MCDDDVAALVVDNGAYLLLLFLIFFYYYFFFIKRDQRMEFNWIMITKKDYIDGSFKLQLWKKKCESVLIYIIPFLEKQNSWMQIIYMF